MDSYNMNDQRMTDELFNLAGLIALISMVLILTFNFIR